MGESTRRSVRTAVDLRDAINTALDAVVIVTLHDAEKRGAVCEEQISRIMLAVDEYIDHLRNQWLEHHAGRLILPTINQQNQAPALTDFCTGPALVYVHTDSQTITAVDRAPVAHSTAFYDNGSRERAISRALITEALRLLEDTP